MAPDADPALDFGDRVQIRVTPETVAAGVDGRVGQVYGHTTPSKGYLTDPVIGELRSDLAFNVQFDDADESVWITPDLLDLIDHAPGMTIGIGGDSFVRQQDGSWERTDR